MASSYRFVVRGRVQGVGFRYSTMVQARSLGLSGWVRNRDDGAVEGCAGGAPDALERFHAWLQHGPRAARIESVDWGAGEEQPAGGFVVRG
jgi:acylphosphatase